MIKARAFFVYLFVIAGFISCLAPVFVRAQGYEGLIAAPPPEEEAAPPPAPSAPASESGGYYGLLAPAPAPAPAAGAPAPQQEPVGYGGLIPGVAGGPAATQPAPVAAQPAPVKTSDDLKAAAAAQAEDRDGNAVPDSIETPDRLSGKSAQRLSRPRPRIQNMLPVEYMAKQNVELMMSEVRNRNFAPEARAENARKAREKLSTLATGLRFRKMVPDKTYLDMGLSDTFIREEKEGNEKALARLDAALEELKGYQ